MKVQTFLLYILMNVSIVLYVSPNVLLMQSSQKMSFRMIKSNLLRLMPNYLKFGQILPNKRPHSLNARSLKR